MVLRTNISCDFVGLHRIIEGEKAIIHKGKYDQANEGEQKTNHPGTLVIGEHGQFEELFQNKVVNHQLANNNANNYCHDPHNNLQN